MSLSAVRHIASPRSLETKDDAQAYQEHLLAEFVFARAAHGVLDSTIRQDVAAVEEFLSYSGLLAWEIEPGHADRFLGQAQRDRAVATRRGKAICIDTFYRFLEVRYRGEIHQLTGHLVCSPIDSVNRPAHTGDFSVRIPPTPAELKSFFKEWRAELPEVRKWLVASRNYTMARLLGDVGLRVRELCALSLDDLHFEHGPLGKIHVRMGKGGRVGPDSFRSALHQAARRHLTGRVTDLTPHVLRHACASELYRAGVNLGAIQQLLGHRWLSTTMGYVHVATQTIEDEYLKAAQRSAARFR